MKNLFKIVLVLFLALFLNCTAYAKNEAITVISDIHLSSDKSQNKMTPTVSKLIKAVEQANMDTSSCVVLLGDNASSANRVDIAMVSKIAKKIKKPYFIIPGNREINKSKGIDKKEFFRIVNKFSSNKISELPAYKKHGDFVFVFMSGVNETFPTYKGYYKMAEVEFLDKTLTKFKDKKVIIFQHFPIMEPATDESRETVKKEGYLDVLKQHNNVIAIVSGHYHTEAVQTIDNIKHISIPPLYLRGEYEQIKIFNNKDGSYSIITRLYAVD